MLNLLMNLIDLFRKRESMKNFYYYNPTKIIFGKGMIQNILNTPLSVLLKQRNESDLCKKCMSKGVHRFFDINAKVENIDGKRIVRRF